MQYFDGRWIFRVNLSRIGLTCCQEFHKIRKFFQEWQFTQFSNSSGIYFIASISLLEFYSLEFHKKMASRKFWVLKHLDVDWLNGTFNQFVQNLTELSHEERESIIRVLKRDAELNDLESERVFRLKRILKDFKRRGIGKDRISMKLNGPTFSYFTYFMANMIWRYHIIWIIWYGPSSRYRR